MTTAATTDATNFLQKKETFALLMSLLELTLFEHIRVDTFKSPSMNVLTRPTEIQTQTPIPGHQIFC